MIEQTDPRLQRATLFHTLSYILFCIALLVLAAEAFVERGERATQGALLLACWGILVISFILRFRADHHRAVVKAQLEPRPASAVESPYFRHLCQRSKKLHRLAVAFFALALGGSTAKLFVPLEQLTTHTVIEGGTFTAFFAGMMVGVVSRHVRRQAEL